MRLKKLVIWIVILAVIFLGSGYAVKNYIFPYKHKEAIEKYSKEYDLDPYLVLAVIKAESKFNSIAESHKGAKGLMQITESTAEDIASKMKLDDYSKEKLYDEDYNIKMGCWYLNDLRKEFGDIDLYIAAYNAGRGNVNKWLKDENCSDDGKNLKYIPYKETKEYVDRVKTYYKIYTKIYSK